MLFALLGGCEESPDEARFKLGQLGYQFTPFSLMQAAGQNDHVAVKLLILAGMEPDTVLDRSVVNAEYERLGTDGPEAWNRLGARGHSTALGIAAGLGHTETVRVLLEAGADPEKRDSGRRTPLMRAMEGGHVETAEALLDADAGVEGEDFEESVATAASNNDVVMLNLLMNLGIGVSIRSEVSVTALMEAASEGALDVISVLIESGTDMDAQRVGRRGEETETALILACQRNRVDVVRLLLESGADPNIRTSRGRTALMVASMSGYVEIVRLLLDAGADPDIAENNGNTALTWATGQIRDGWFARSREDPHAEVVKLLLDAGADPDRPGRGGNSAFMVAVEKNNAAVLKAMLEAGADPGAHDEAGNTLLMQGLSSGLEAELRQSLIRREAEAGRINHQNEHGFTALMIATNRKSRAMQYKHCLQPALIRMVQSARGTTALMRAADRGDNQILTALLEAGRRPDVEKRQAAKRPSIRYPERCGVLHSGK